MRTLSGVPGTGIKHMVVHSGYIPNLYYKEWHLEKSVEFWKEYMADKPETFYLYIENVFEDEPYLLKNMIDDIGDTRVKMCLDTGHVNASSQKCYSILDWIRELGDRIGHVHIHNNYGKRMNMDPFLQGIWIWKKLLKRSINTVDRK